jgi:hypothetical protein
VSGITALGGPSATDFGGFGLADVVGDLAADAAAAFVVVRAEVDIAHAGAG